MCDKKNIFKINDNLNKSEKIAKSLIGNLHETNNNDNLIKINNIKIKSEIKKENKKYMNLSIRPELIQKVKNYAKENNLSVSALFEQIIEQL